MWDGDGVRNRVERVGWFWGKVIVKRGVDWVKLECVCVFFYSVVGGSGVG